MPREKSLFLWAVVSSFALLSCSANAQSVLSSFDPGGYPVGIGYGNDELFVHTEFGSGIQVFDRSGNLIRTIPKPISNHDAYEIEFLDSPINLGGEQVPAGALLLAYGVREIFAVDAADGNVLATLAISDLATGGIAYDDNSGLIYSVGRDSVQFFNPANGSEAGSFAVASPGSPGFSTFYDDIDIDSNGNLQIVTDEIEGTAVLSTNGIYLQDIDLSHISPDFGMEITGIAFDVLRGEAWVASTSRLGTVYQLTGLQRIPEPSSALALAIGCLSLLLRRGWRGLSAGVDVATC